MNYFASPSERTTRPPSAPPAERLSGLASTEPQSQDGEICSVCPHRIADHDRIGLRFCHATAAGALVRGCACG